MLEITRIRSEKDAIIEGLKKRHFDAAPILTDIIEKDETWRKAKAELDAVLAEMNAAAKSIGSLMKEGKKDEAESLKSKVADWKEQEADFKIKVQELEDQIQQLMYLLPNVPNEMVKAGRDENDNETIFESGTKREYTFEPLPHWDLAKKYELIDFELGVKVTGAGFPFYRGQGAKIQRALINFFLKEAEIAGYEEFITPHVVNEASGYGTGQLPDKEGQMYHMPVDGLYMIPTAEVPLTNIYRDVVLPSEDFSIKLTGYTPCFRREAGSYGKDVRGLNRLHQFDKVEIVRIEHPDNSAKALEDMVDHVKGLLEKLGLQYRILRLCGGDTGFASAMTYDFEVWSAAQQRWLEVSSVSRFDTFQATRLKLRYKTADKKTALAHTLNGSALALPRILAALLENYQEEDHIRIPECLHPFLSFTEIK